MSILKGIFKGHFIIPLILGISSFLVFGCPLTLKDQINKAILPPNAQNPWITSYGDRSVTLSWAEPSNSDMAAVEVVAYPVRATGVTPVQAVVGNGTLGTTLTLPGNNVGYKITVYMVDKAGHVADTGASTKNSYSPHYLVDSASRPFLENSVASQHPISTVTHFTGSGVGTYNGYDSYTYDATTGLPSVIITYNSAGTPLSKWEIHYATGGISRVLDLLYSYYGTGWLLTTWVNTYYDSSGRVSKTELYGGSSRQLQYTSTYNRSSSGDLTGWVTSDGAGLVYQKVAYTDQGTREQWAVCDANGVLLPTGLAENDYDSAGRKSVFTQFNKKDMSVSYQENNLYDSNGNLLKVTFIAGTPLQQTNYDVYSY